MNYSQATDEINAQFLTAWKAQAAAIVGYEPEVYWQNVQNPKIPDGSKFWARVSAQTVFEQQITFASCRKFEVSGLVFVQIFCPKSNSQSFELGKKLATVAKLAYRGQKTESGVWFRNVRINEIEPEDQFYRLNVIAEFEYDES